MKFKNSIISLILFAAIIVSVFCLPAAASAQESITYFEDGSYVVSTIRVLPSARGVNATKSGEKTNDYFGSNGEKLYQLPLLLRSPIPAVQLPLLTLIIHTQSVNPHGRLCEEVPAVPALRLQQLQRCVA
jgi:hypothetical protein